MPTRLSNAKFKSIFHQVPRLCVELAIIKKDKVLFTLRAIHPYQGKWHLPGGTVLFDESIDEAVQRVAHEELGVSVRIDKLLGYIDWYSETEYVGNHAVSLVILVTPDSENFQLDRQASEYQYRSPFSRNVIDTYVPFFKQYLPK